MPYIRLFAAFHESPVGLLALAYMRSLVRIAPVRLADPHGKMPDLVDTWKPFWDSIATPMNGPMLANVVCCDPARWRWTHHVNAPLKNEPGSAMEKISGDIELYTAGARNVIVLPSHRRLTVSELEAAGKYEVVIVPQFDMELDLLMTAGHQQPVVIPIPVTDHAAVRRAITGS